MLVFVASKSTTLVEQFQMEYDQIPDKFLRPPSNKPSPQISPHTKTKNKEAPRALIQGTKGARKLTMSGLTFHA